MKKKRKEALFQQAISRSNQDDNTATEQSPADIEIDSNVNTSSGGQSLHT